MKLLLAVICVILVGCGGGGSDCLTVDEREVIGGDNLKPAPEGSYCTVVPK